MDESAYVGIPDRFKFQSHNLTLEPSCQENPASPDRGQPEAQLDLILGDFLVLITGRHRGANNETDQAIENASHCRFCPGTPRIPLVRRIVATRKAAHNPQGNAGPKADQ